MKNKLLTLTMSLMVFCTNADSQEQEQGQAQGVMSNFCNGECTAVCPEGTKVVSGGCASGLSAISVSRPISSVFEAEGWTGNEGWMCQAGLCLDFNTGAPEISSNAKCAIRAFAVCQ